MSETPDNDVDSSYAEAVEKASSFLGDFLAAPDAAKISRLQQAITLYRSALRGYTREAFPEEWAKIQYNLGLAYTNLPLGERSFNLDSAIACYEAALLVFTRQTFPNEWASILHNLGSVSADLPYGDRGANLSRAIAYYEAALLVHTRKAYPNDWAMIQHNMGNTYASFPVGDQGANLSNALSCYNAALQVTTRERAPFLWAVIQSNIGNVYSEIPIGNRGANLSHAIAYYEAALQEHTQEEFPFHWARTQSSLGNVYQLLPMGDRGANLSRAIAHYEAALQEHTQEAFPIDWARTQNSLGVVYLDLPFGDRGANLSRAIAYFKASLQVFTRQAFPFYWARRQSNLGLAYTDLPSGDRGANLSRAIAHYEAALQEHTQEAFPIDWARTQHNLGNAYANLPIGDRSANLARAISCYESALQVYTQQTFPFYWAGTKSNLGNVYANLTIGDRGVNLSRAISCYKSALQVFTQQAFPRERLDSLDNLTSLHVQQSDWQTSLLYCEDGIHTLESLRTIALTAAERTRLLTTSLAFFDRAVLCSYRMQHYEQALVYAERGKTRNLVDSLVTRTARPRQVPEEKWNHYQQNLTDSQNIEQQLALHYRTGEHSNSVVALLHEQAAELYAQRRQIEADFHRLDPNYLPTIPPLTFSDIRTIVAHSEAVLVEFRVTEAGTFIFLLAPHEQTLEKAQVLHLTDFTETTLQQILVRYEGEELVAGWLFHHEALDPSKPETLVAWQHCIENVTRDLYAQLIHPVRHLLLTRYPHVNKIVLVPNKILNVLPLHATHWEHEGERHYLLDEYEIQYAPSCMVLRICQESTRSKSKPTSLFAVQNPTLNLPFADWEVEEAGRHFMNKHIVSGPAASLDGVRASIGKGEEVFFSCHGFFDLKNPSASYFSLSSGDRLLLGEILQMDLSEASVAILSACETAFSDVQDTTDEVQGLHTAFVLARIPTVIGGGWSVDDLSTALLMIQLHRNVYTESMGYGQALRQAQQWVRDVSRQEAETFVNSTFPSGGARAALAQRLLRRLAPTPSARPFAHPYWWAAFQCMGISSTILSGPC